MNDTAKTQNLPFATDEECAELRQRLIRAGKIVPAKPDAEDVTIPSCAKEDFVPIPSTRRRNIADIPEEGVYKLRRIQSDEEYERRKRNYFIMLQSVLRSREELRLEFGDHEDDGETEEIDGRV
jgi:hypothetical protein